MNTSRILVLGGAGVAAIVAALLVRSFLGGGTQTARADIPRAMPMSEVLVASTNVDSGTKLNISQVHWQQWPKSSVDASFITKDGTPNINAAIEGTVVRAPLIAGQPVTASNLVHTNSTGIMAANLSPGMRAVSIGISTESGAGGFILPNDRVDVMVTQQIGSAHNFRTHMVLGNVRVLAVDQTYKQDKEQKVVLAKTATLELSPSQAQAVEKAQASGTISLALRSLTDGDPQNQSVASTATSGQGVNDVYVLRYGIPRTGAGAGAQGE